MYPLANQSTDFFGGVVANAATWDEDLLTDFVWSKCDSSLFKLTARVAGHFV